MAAIAEGLDGIAGTEAETTASTTALPSSYPKDDTSGDLNETDQPNAASPRKSALRSRSAQVSNPRPKQSVVFADGTTPGADGLPRDKMSYGSHYRTSSKSARRFRSVSYDRMEALRATQKEYTAKEFPYLKSSQRQSFAYRSANGPQGLERHLDRSLTSMPVQQYQDQLHSRAVQLNEKQNTLPRRISVGVSNLVKSARTKLTNLGQSKGAATGGASDVVPESNADDYEDEDGDDELEGSASGGVTAEPSDAPEQQQTRGPSTVSAQAKLPSVDDTNEDIEGGEEPEEDDEAEDEAEESGEEEDGDGANELGDNDATTEGQDTNGDNAGAESDVD
jgi:hypothetical protein